MEASRYSLATELHPDQAADVFSNQIQERGVKMHCHDFSEVLWVTSGRLLHTINGIEQELNAGDLVMILPDDTHSLYARDEAGGTIENTAFPTRLLASLLEPDQHWFAHNNPAGGSGLAPTVSVSPAQLNILRQLHQQTIRSNASHTAVLALLMCAKATVHHAFSTNHNEQQIPAWLKKLRSDMTHTPHVIRGRDALSELSNKNISYIHRMWKKYFLQTPGQFINDERISLAKVTLAQSSKDIIEICYDIGFNDLSYFYRLFKRQVGCTPMQYRKNNIYASGTDL